MISYIKFLGNFREFPSGAEIGSMIDKEGNKYVFDGINWVLVGPITDTNVTIKGGMKKETAKLARWKYSEIIVELTSRGADQNQAIDGAKWCARAETGSEKSIPVSGRPTIMLKVR